MAMDGAPYVKIGWPIQLDNLPNGKTDSWVWAEVGVQVGEPGRDLLDNVKVTVSVSYDPGRPRADLEREAKDMAIQALEEARNLLAQP